MTGPCGWVVGQCTCSPTAWDDYSAEARAQGELFAAHFLWAATGRRYGLCEVTVMPCNPPRPEPAYQTFPLRTSYNPYSGGYQLSVSNGSVRTGGCGAGCSCTAPCEVRLAVPVESIVEVLIDGEPVDPSTYQVHNFGILVRLGGLCWPTCATYGEEIPGFEVTYLRGTRLPDAVQAAFEVLACEYASACSNPGGECRLPTNLQSLTRQGVEVTVQEVDTAKGRMRTGIAKVDDVIEADNPYGLVQAPTVISPDMPPPARMVTWAGGS